MGGGVWEGEKQGNGEAEGWKGGVPRQPWHNTDGSLSLSLWVRHDVIVYPRPFSRSLPPPLLWSRTNHAATHRNAMASTTLPEWPPLPPKQTTHLQPDTTHLLIYILEKKGSIQIPFLTNFETVTFIPQTILIPHPYDTTQCTSLTKPRCRHITGNNAASSLQGNHYIFLRSACSSDPGLWALEILCLLKTKCAL